MAGTDGRARPAARYEELLAGVLERSAAYARSILRDRHEAEDAVQQAALRALERWASYDPERPFAAWWFAILRNCCTDVLRARRPSVDLDRVPDLASAPEASPGAGEDWEELAACLARVGPDHEEMLRLRYFGGLTYDELAGALRIPRGTVMSRLHYARRALAAEIERARS